MVEIEAYRLFLVEEGKKKATVKTYINVVKHLLLEVRPLDARSFRKYILQSLEAGRRPGYLNRQIDVMRSFARFAKLEGFEAIRYVKAKPIVKATLSDREIEMFLALPPVRNGMTEHHNYQTWTVFFTIMAYTGMRPGEVAKLTVSDIDYGQGVFLLEDTKTGDNRYVPIPSSIIPLIDSHMQTLKGELLFPSKRHSVSNSEGVVDNVDWHYNFHTRITRLGIKRKHLTPYSLRHSFITRLLDEDVNLFKVQRIVGHRKIETTASYTHLTTKSIKKAMLKDPLGRKHLTHADRLRSYLETIRGMSLEEDREIDYAISETENGFSLSVSLKST